MPLSASALTGSSGASPLRRGGEGRRAAASANGQHDHHSLHSHRHSPRLSGADANRGSGNCPRRLHRAAHHRTAARDVRRARSSPPRSMRTSIGDAALLADARAFDPLPRRATMRAGRRWCREHRYRATPATPRSTICRAATPPSPSSPSRSTATPRAFAKALAWDASPEARQPVGQSVERRWTSWWTHSPARDPVGHALRRGAGGIGRDPVRGPAPAD